MKNFFHKALNAIVTGLAYFVLVLTAAFAIVGSFLLMSKAIDSDNELYMALARVAVYLIFFFVAIIGRRAIEVIRNSADRIDSTNSKFVDYVEEKLESISAKFKAMFGKDDGITPLYKTA